MGFILIGTVELVSLSSLQNFDKNDKQGAKWTQSSW